VLLLKATNPEYNQPLLHIKQASKDGDAASDGALKYMGSKGTITTIAPA
jgi:hypothetical protein